MASKSIYHFSDGYTNITVLNDVAVGKLWAKQPGTSCGLEHLLPDPSAARQAKKEKKEQEELERLRLKCFYEEVREADHVFLSLASPFRCALKMKRAQQLAPTTSNNFPQIPSEMPLKYVLRALQHRSEQALPGGIRLRRRRQRGAREESGQAS